MPHGPDKQDTTLEEHLPMIRNLITKTAQRHRVPDQGEFESRVLLKLADRSRSPLRRFREESSLRTYLTMVLTNLAKDYRIEEWGRWRSSAEARRHGAPGERLESLLCRDGFSVHEAVEIVRRNDGCRTPRGELHDLALRLQAQAKRVLASEESWKWGATQAGSLPVETSQDRHNQAADAVRLIGIALWELPPDDRALLRLRFVDGLTVASIATTLRVPQRGLYSRFDRCLKLLRSKLEANGLTGEAVVGMLQSPEIDLSAALTPLRETPSDVVGANLTAAGNGSNRNNHPVED